jgi:flagellin
VASAFKEKLLPDYVGTATVSAGVLTLQPGAQVGDVDISIDVYQLEDSKNLGKISSTVSAVSSDPAVARQIEIADHDVYAGNRFELRVGNPEVSNTFSVIAGTNDSASTIATKLSNQLKSLYGDSAAGSSGATVTNGVITLTAGLNLGMSSISLGVNDMSPGVAVEAQSSVNAKTRDDRARTITISQSDLQIGNQVTVSLLGKTYSTTVTSLDDATTVAGKLASKLSEDFSAIDGVEQLVISGNQITFGTNARLGNDQIDVVVKQVSSSDSLTLSALGVDGRVMDFQSISLGTVQSGSRSELRFDQMGVVITATNLSATSISGADVFESGLTGNSLVVGAVGSRAALVQVGGSANQNIVLDGFADIRLNGNNQGDAQYRGVFDDLSDAIDLISTKSALALTEDNFGDLESLVEAAITSIAGARASLGVQQNRVEFAIANLLAQQSQLESARSQILDTDFAAETARLTRMQIGQQASTAMLAQANQLPNVILALLK